MNRVKDLKIHEINEKIKDLRETILSICYPEPVLKSCLDCPYMNDGVCLINYLGDIILYLDTEEQINEQNKRSNV